ncbi:prepilin-type N-terminal cleavage/methylation domain-containing protein [Candidatus Berkelbacteria bacterium]|nr:prepilin-type N-terminal cleavage/methylation domain-containing protein [Candidatus Berkelbacteria bacterium]
MSRANDQSGFTIIELMVSVGIISAMLALGVPAFRSYSRQVNFDATADSIGALIEDARTLALSPETTKAAAVTAYGVEFDSIQGLVMVNRYAMAVLPQRLSEVKRLTIVPPIILQSVPTQPLLFPITAAGELVTGTGNPVTVVLRNDSLRLKKTRTLTINPATSQVTIQ